MVSSHIVPHPLEAVLACHVLDLGSGCKLQSYSVVLYLRVRFWCEVELLQSCLVLALVAAGQGADLCRCRAMSGNRTALAFLI